MVHAAGLAVAVGERDQLYAGADGGLRPLPLGRGSMWRRHGLRTHPLTYTYAGYTEIATRMSDTNVYNPRGW